MDELKQFYSGYFADQSTAEGAIEIAFVYSQSDEMKKAVLNNLDQMDRLIANCDERVLDIFEETCLFYRTGKDEQDFREVKNLADAIKASILQSPYWQSPSGSTATS